MPVSKFERFLPIAGIIAGLFYIAAVVLTGDIPDDVNDKRTAWLKAHEGMTFSSGVATAFFAVFVLFFVTGLRQALRSGEPGESSYSTAALAGGIALGSWGGLSALITLAETQAAKDDHPEASFALGYLDSYIWVPFVIAAAVLLVATGLGGIRTAQLPKWLGIVSIVLGVLAVTGPTGIAVFLLMPLWLIVVGALLSRRLSRSANQQRGAGVGSSQLVG
jgi:hypothetical protein